ncbi:hypothetical protein GCM10012285_25750 [Streptomyces kronopolitis]|uniref:Uncharacterized protein n=1 Tax=Streptomyces kronopolitis TaxID=1612435 RepID=A0ABQ2JC21_9ACTN|nr:hypothetical protein GCM10012285_25750 [Streptomyces kronopolitis]
MTAQPGHRPAQFMDPRVTLDPGHSSVTLQLFHHDGVLRGRCPTRDAGQLTPLCAARAIRRAKKPDHWRDSPGGDPGGAPGGCAARTPAHAPDLTESPSARAPSYRAGRPKGVTAAEPTEAVARTLHGRPEHPRSGPAA